LSNIGAYYVHIIDINKFEIQLTLLENQFIYPIPLRGSKLILTSSNSYRLIGTRFFAPLGAGVNEENQLVLLESPGTNYYY